MSVFPDPGFCPLQTGEGWNTCVQSKADGAFNLDVESRNLPEPLDVFVLFSSAIAEIGNAGKSSMLFNLAYWHPVASDGT